MLLLVIIAVSLRVWCLAGEHGFIGDEAAQIPAAQKYAAHGQSDNTFWHHPPLGLLLLDGSIRTFGDNPLGWRFRNIAAGSLSTAVVFLVSLRLLKSRRSAFLAGLMLAVDPLHIKMSGFSMDEIPAAFFFLLALVPYCSAGRRTIPGLLLFSLAAGCSIATKSYYLVSFLLLVLLMQYSGEREEDLSPLYRLNLFLICIVPACAVYVASYLPWFMRGYGVTEFFRMIADTLQDLSRMDRDWFLEYESLSRTLSPAYWFVTPRIVQGAGFVNSPLTWLPVLPAALFAGYRLKRGGAAEGLSGESLALLLFLSCYLPLLAVSRPIFIYSAVAVIPFAFVLVSFSLQALIDRFGWGRWGYGVLVAAIGSWGWYLYPLAIG